MNIEELYTQYMEDNYHKMLHKVISSYKPNKTCPMKGNCISYAPIEDLK